MTRVMIERRSTSAISVAYGSRKREEWVKPRATKETQERAAREEQEEKKSTRPRRKRSVRSNAHAHDLPIIMRYRLLLTARASVSTCIPRPGTCRQTLKTSHVPFAGLHQSVLGIKARWRRERSGLISETSAAAAAAAARISYSFYRSARSTSLRILWRSYEPPYERLRRPLNERDFYDRSTPHFASYMLADFLIRYRTISFTCVWKSLRLQFNVVL